MRFLRPTAKSIKRKLSTTARFLLMLTLMFAGMLTADHITAHGYSIVFASGAILVCSFLTVLLIPEEHDRDDIEWVPDDKPPSRESE